MSRRFSWLVILSICATVQFGCGGSDTPPLGLVSGRVTYNDEPLSGVVVNFKPEEGRMATGLTDANGNYELEYVYRVKGTKIGANTVSFSWPTGAAGSVSIPAKYGHQTELKEDVKPGRNTIDFDLKGEEASSKPKPALPG